MTTSVADKTPIPGKIWRRHTDPPGMWIIVAISSASLHLLAFWLLRSSNGFRPWFPQQNQASIPIEVVELSPTAKSNSPAKTVSKQPRVLTQKPVTTAPTTSINQDADVIISDASRQPERDADASRPNSQVFGEQTNPQPNPTPTTEPEPEPSFTPTPKFESTPIPTPTPTIPFSDRPWNNRDEVILGRGKPLPNDLPEELRNPEPQPRETGGDRTNDIPPNSNNDTGGDRTNDIPPNSNNDTGGDRTNDIPPNSNNDTGSDRSNDIPPNSNNDTGSDRPNDIPPNSNNDTGGDRPNDVPPNSNSETGSDRPNNVPPNSNDETQNTRGEETQPSSTIGGSIARVAALGEDEVRQIIKNGILNLKPEDLPDVLSVYQGSTTKTVDSSYLPRDSALEPASFLASFIIDQDGKFQQVEVIEIDQGLKSKKSLYEKVITELFRNESFIPGHNRDGTKPGLSNLFVRITIEPISPTK